MMQRCGRLPLPSLTLIRITVGIGLGMIVGGGHQRKLLQVERLGRLSRRKKEAGESHHEFGGGSRGSVKCEGGLVHRFGLILHGSKYFSIRQAGSPLLKESP